MNNEQKFWVCIWAVLLVPIACISICGIFAYKDVRLSYIENGYEQTTVVGYACPVWEKAEEKK